MADSLMALGMKKALVVCSTVGDLSLDEMTPCGPTNVVEVTPAGTKAYSFNPKDVGIPPCELKDLAGGDAKLNARMLTDALGGEKGPVADCLMLNAGVAMAAAAQAESVEEGVAMCKEAHAQGKAGDTLRSWIELSQELKLQEA
jgi:anthranilate phosphoribosyltransferase